MERGDFLGQSVGGVSVWWAGTGGCPELKPGDFLGGAIGGVAQGWERARPELGRVACGSGLVRPGSGGVPRARGRGRGGYPVVLG